jgi:hypothetical protein
MTIPEFYEGMEIVHPDYGHCQVIYIGSDYVGVEFKDGKFALFKKYSFEITPNNRNPENDAIKKTSIEPALWPSSTFVYEDSGVVHFMGAHWQPFFDDATIILRQLPEAIQQGQPWLSFGEIKKAPRQAPAEWSKGRALAWPAQRQGIIIAIRIGQNKNDAMSCFPFFSDAGQHSLVLNRVHVWESGVEAQINATFLNGAVITFFDVGFIPNREWYEAGHHYEFILGGMAYDANPSTVNEIPMNRHPDDLAFERLVAERQGKQPPLQSQTMSLSSMSLLLPIEGWDVDDYQFRGSVKSVKEAPSNILGQAGWIVRTTVIKFDNTNFDLDILITRKAWNSDAPPSIGQDIEGSLWLQGYLWST